MKILYLPQISMRSYNDNRWLLGSDAQLTKMTSYVSNLPQDWEWSWLLPEGDHNHRDEGAFRKLPNVTLYSINMLDNVLENRYYLDVDSVSYIAELVEPDLMLCEVPEHVRTMRVVQRRTGIRFPIVAMYEHVDYYDETKVDESLSFMLRQIEGYIEADANVYPLAEMRTTWRQHATTIVSPHTINRKRSAYLWPALFSPKEVMDARVNQTVPRNGPVIFYISRLSDNQRTRFQEFAEACRILREHGADFTVWVANPNEAMDWDQIRDFFPYYQEHPYGEVTLTRAHYLDLLWEADIVPILYDMNKIYSVGFCEAITAGNMVVTESLDGFPTTATFRKADPPHIARAINGAIENVNNEELSAAQVQWLINERSVEKNIQYVQQTIESVTQ